MVYREFSHRILGSLVALVSQLIEDSFQVNMLFRYRSFWFLRLGYSSLLDRRLVLLRLLLLLLLLLWLEALVELHSRCWNVLIVLLLIVRYLGGAVIVLCWSSLQENKNKL